MDEKKFNINLPEGATVVTILEGEAPKQLDQLEPNAIVLKGTLGSVTNFIKNRVNKGQFEIADCHLIVDRENVTMTFVTNECDPRRSATVCGKLEPHPDFASLGVNTSKLWSPQNLAMAFKQHRFWFENREEGMKLVTTLMNFTATVNQKVERHISENGNRGDIFEQVVNSNLPSAISLKMPIFKGSTPQTIEVETFAQIDGKSVGFVLLSPGANEVLNELRDKAIDEQLEQILAIAPQLVVIEK